MAFQLIPQARHLAVQVATQVRHLTSELATQRWPSRPATHCAGWTFRLATRCAGSTSRLLQLVAQAGHPALQLAAQARTSRLASQRSDFPVPFGGTIQLAGYQNAATRSPLKSRCPSREGHHPSIVLMRRACRPKRLRNDNQRRARGARRDARPPISNLSERCRNEASASPVPQWPTSVALVTPATRLGPPGASRSEFTRKRWPSAATSKAWYGAYGKCVSNSDLTPLTSKSRAFAVDLGGHELAVRRHEEQLLAVAPPPRLKSTVPGDEPLRARLRKRRDVHLGLSGFGRTVGHPFAVRRERGPVFLRLCLQERIRLAVARERQHPDVVRRARAARHVENEACRPPTSSRATCRRRLRPAVPGGRLRADDVW